MNCSKCGKENRPEARYCRFCGEQLVQESAAPRKGLIGKESIQKELEKLDQTLKVAGGSARTGTRISMDCLILGDSGSGKTFIARYIAQKMLSSGAVKKAAREVDAADWGEFMASFDKNMSALKDGILLITNAQKLLPTTRATDVIQLDKLFNRMRSSADAPVVILCGMLNDLTAFLDSNKDVSRHFEFKFMLDSFDISGLTRLTLSLLEEQFNMKAAPDLPSRLGSHFAWYLRQKDVSHTNGHLAQKVASELFVKAKLRNSEEVEAQDIDPAQCFVPKTEEEILSDLDQYVGLASVKEEIKAIVRNVKAKKEAGVKGKLIKDHFIFTGNPGTGKTTLARKLGEVLNAIGALPTGQFVEVPGKDLIDRYVGGTEQNVIDAVNKAMGGVLFIDEAYALNDEKGYGAAAVDTLLPILENRKGDFVCILAGYTKEMGDFVRMNPGIESRCNVTIEFPDYNARELEQLFCRLLTHNDENVVFTLDARAREMLPKVFERMYLRRTENFGNARAVRNLFDQAVKRLRLRSPGDTVFTYADLVGEDQTKEISVEDIMKELDGLVGMQNVKDCIRNIVTEVATQKRLIEMGEGGEGLTKYNFILTGNPGTGKTTVARLFGKIFKALEVIPSDRVVEKSPKDLISKYVNESDKLMDAAINEAMGCVLFIDEAYNLCPMDETGKSTSKEGEAAVLTLLKRMEDEAGKFVVILAGYPKPMEALMNSNEGFRRRFSHFIHIDDYTPEELLQIYERAAKASKYDFVLADETVRAKVLSMFRNMVNMKDDKFGNAGEAIKKVAETKTNINKRITALPYDQWKPELVHTAFLEDIPYKEPEKVSVEKCLEELNELIGLEGVKTSLTKLAHTINNEIESARAEGRQPEIPLGHYLFLGNPGTGKTTVARLMGKILYSMGALPSPEVIEVGIAQLKGKYLGVSESLTNHIIDTAMGRILFIDEAYQLASDQYGTSIMDVLLKRLEDDRGKFVCIAAGYTHEMQAFIRSNSGIPSRFPQRNWITFEDYNAEELYQIFMIHVRKGGYTLDPLAQNAVRGRLTMLYNNRDRYFGNGREARHLFDEIKSNLAARLAEDGKTHTPEERKTIMMEDVL